jgi:TRAP-type mannitol/chloroaromatic compound transport system permease small subunit
VTSLARVARGICALNLFLGHVFSWFTLGIVLICFLVVVLRYVFATSFVWMQDLYVWMNGIMFTGIAGYVLMRDGHVRVDILYRPWSTRRKAWLDLLGFFLFLAPFAMTVLIWSWTYVQRSWRFQESSTNVGGLPGLYVVKTFIVIFAVVILLQGIAMALRSILVLNGREELLPADLRYPKQA